MAEDRKDEARARFDRVERDAEVLGGSSLARMSRRLGGHFTARDAIGAGEGGGTDPIELWGRRIGRGLSLVGVVVLAYWLAVQLRFL